MKARRWMKTLIAEAKKTEKQMTLAWTRQHRRKRALAKPAKVSAAE